MRNWQYLMSWIQCSTDSFIYWGIYDQCFKIPNFRFLENCITDLHCQTFTSFASGMYCLYCQVFTKSITLAPCSDERQDEEDKQVSGCGDYSVYSNHLNQILTCSTNKCQYWVNEWSCRLSVGSLKEALKRRCWSKKCKSLVMNFSPLWIAPTWFTLAMVWTEWGEILVWEPIPGSIFYVLSVSNSRTKPAG